MPDRRAAEQTIPPQGQGEEKKRKEFSFAAESWQVTHGQSPTVLAVTETELTVGRVISSCTTSYDTQVYLRVPTLYRDWVIPGSASYGHRGVDRAITGGRRMCDWCPDNQTNFRSTKDMSHTTTVPCLPVY